MVESSSWYVHGSKHRVGSVVDAEEEAAQEEAAPAVDQGAVYVPKSLLPPALHWLQSLNACSLGSVVGPRRSSILSVVDSGGRASSLCWVTGSAIAQGSSMLSDATSRWYPGRRADWLEDDPANGGCPLGVPAEVTEEGNGGGGGAGREGGGGAPPLMALGPHRGGEDVLVSRSVYVE